MDKTPQLVSGTDVFGPDSRFYYSIRTRIDPAEYPQVHDFYEIILVTGGELGVLAAGARFALRPGGLLLLRPGDAHTKLEQGPCTHIDLAFPAGTARELVCYLYQDDGPLRALAELPLPPQAQLTAGDAADVQERLARLNRLPPASAKKAPCCARCCRICFPAACCWPARAAAVCRTACRPGWPPHWKGWTIPPTWAGRGLPTWRRRAGARRSTSAAVSAGISAARLPPIGTAGGWTMRSTC